MKCGPTGDDCFCACGCSGIDERCDVWQAWALMGMEVPDSHTCCKVFYWHQDTLDNLT